MDAKHALYIVVAVIGSFLLLFKLGGPSLSDATVINHPQGQTVLWSELARYGFLGAGIVFCLCGFGLGLREYKPWGTIVAFGLFGLFVIVISIVLMWPSRIGLYADRVEIRDRPRYLSEPLVIYFANINHLSTHGHHDDKRYVFDLVQGDTVELGYNPILDKAWPLIQQQIHPLP